MAMIDPILSELEQESQSTLRLLERVPEDRLSWRPHSKSMSLGKLALHVAQLPGAISRMALVDAIDAPPFHQPEATSRQQLIEVYRTGLAAARSDLSQMDDARMMASWKVMKGDQVMMSMPRVALLRVLMLNHSYHHRGQLTVYLRMLDIPLPSVYGPSADENPF
jgi:uncharacterized damage-inducible protein DinB